MNTNPEVLRELIEMNDHIEELKKRGMITSLARVPDARTDSLARAEELLAKEVGCRVEDLGAAFIQRDDALRAIARALEQPAAAEGEEIMVDTPYDVYILPLRPSGLSSGPRFVVHVPQPEAQEGKQ